MTEIERGTRRFTITPTSNDGKLCINKNFMVPTKIVHFGAK